MTTPNSTPDNAAPTDVTVIPCEQLKPHLGKIISRFRSGEQEPIFFGVDNVTPEAAIIPFSDWLRLAAYDAEHEEQFQAEVARRVRESDARRAAGESEPTMSLDEFTASLRKTWAEEHPARGSDE
jgi:PHD/YefM family antitoxin component YafN of YafNO toxin-antitoxin module